MFIFNTSKTQHTHIRLLLVAFRGGGAGVLRNKAKIFKQELDAEIN
jgi:hypothetical protein